MKEKCSCVICFAFSKGGFHDGIVKKIHNGIERQFMSGIHTFSCRITNILISYKSEYWIDESIRIFPRPSDFDILGNEFREKFKRKMENFMNEFSLWLWKELQLIINVIIIEGRKSFGSHFPRVNHAEGKLETFTTFIFCNTVNKW